MLKYTAIISNLTIRMDCVHKSLAFPTTLKWPSLNKLMFCTARGMTTKTFVIVLWKRLCLKTSSQGEWKCLVDPMVSFCMANWGLKFCPILNCCVQTWNLGYDTEEPHLVFYMISHNPNVGLGIVDCSLCTRRIALKDEYYKKKWTCLHIILWSSTIWRLQQRFLSFPPDKTNSFKKTFLTMARSSNCHCNEHKLCIHNIVLWKPFVVWTIWSRTN